MGRLSIELIAPDLIVEEPVSMRPFDAGDRILSLEIGPLW